MIETEGKCSNPDCAAPINCHESIDNFETSCKHWLKNNSQIKTKLKKQKSDIVDTNLPWSGEAFVKSDIQQISRRNSPVIIGIIGKADAGKTTFLAMLFTLLLRGKNFNKYEFTGTKTIIGWDQLYDKLKVQKDNVAFPDATPSEYCRLFHLALKNENNQLKDVLLSEASGEVFTLWAQNRNAENVENAGWIYSNSNAFILFIDCMDLVNRKNAAKTEIIDLAQMLKSNLKDRPVIAIWSKSDQKERIHPQIKKSLKSELESLFRNYKELDVSNFSFDDPDEYVHVNNILVIDWLLETVLKPDGNYLIVENQNIDDTFLNYKGHE